MATDDGCELTAYIAERMEDPEWTKAFRESRRRAARERRCFPLCHLCRERHPYGVQTAFEDDDVLWCARCYRPLNEDQECGHGDCCGYALPTATRRVRTRAVVGA